jgi:drug/metabolite transporter (DMT)-like permease
VSAAAVPATPAAAPRRATQGVALAAAALAVSTGAPLARWAAPMPPMAIAALRTLVAGMVLCLLGRRQLRAVLALRGHDRARVIGAGLLLGVHFGSWIASLSWTSTTASVALVSTSPAFAALLAGFNRDRVTRREWAGIAIAAVGCTVLAGGDWTAGGRALVGDGLALVGAMSAAGYLILGRKLRHLPMTPYLGIVNLIAATGLLIGCAASASSPLPPSATAALAVTLAGVVTSAGGHTLLNAVVRILPTHLVALASLGETVGSSLLTWAAFGEVPSWHGALGGAIVIVGIGLGFVTRRSAPPPSPASYTRTQ